MRPQVTVVCARCGRASTYVQVTSLRRYCSKACAVRAGGSERDHRKRDGRRTSGPLGKLVRVDRTTIGDRDGWICHICGAAVDRTKRYPDRRSPSLDHLTPLAAGGRHEPSNVAISHLGCNLERGTRPVDTVPVDWPVDLGARPWHSGSVYLQRGRWTGYLRVDGRKRYVPTFDTAAEVEIALAALSLTPGAVRILAARRRSRPAIQAGNVPYVMGDSE